MKQVVLFVFFIVLSFHITLADYQQERIISFDSQISIQRNSSMLVTETIKVHSEGNKIKRGIYRNFPTDYKDNFGNNIRISFEIVEVLRDGKIENYHTEKLTNGIRVYFGSSSYYLHPGDYTYQITYKTDRQLGYFNNYDELYWNVTGNGWEFDIESASVTVILPEGISRDDINLLAFTGYEGSRRKDYKSEVLNNNTIKFRTTYSLLSKEGLTIVVQWPKGFVREPDFNDRLRYFLTDNKSGIVVMVGILILLIYYFFTWLSLGVDPSKGTIIPLYSPPANLSPAAVRFINKMRFDNKAFAAAVINLCVKGSTILEEDKKDYTLIKKVDGTVSQLSKDELNLISNLKFRNRDGREVLELKQINHAAIKSAITVLKNSLKNSFEKYYFITNMKYFIIGIVLSVVTLLVAGLFGSEDLVFTLIWNVIWSGGVSILLYTVFKTWRTALAGKISGAALVSALFLTLFAVPFVAGLILGLYFLTEAGSFLLIIGIVLVVLLNIIFHHLLKAPTKLGRKIMDQIDGFKMYLSVAEKDRLNTIKEPEITPELFEKFLPYAIALDVENEWGEKFESMLEKAAVDGKSYSPGWYHGALLSTLGVSSIGSSLGSSLTSTISSSSTAPGSSSGGSGGSSGGGGGGGGGGGW